MAGDTDASKSIAAFSPRERVANYDAEMDVMHPNRPKMVSVALEVLPFAPDDEITAVDLGVGTGYFTLRFLQAFPDARVIAIDGSEAMIEAARVRLADYESRIDYRQGDFRALSRVAESVTGADVVYSSYALHHLTFDEKAETMRQARALLKPGGWFLNADVLVAESPAAEERIQELRARGIMSRAPDDERFATIESTLRLLFDMEEEEGDQPLTLQQDLDALNAAGFADVTTWWREYREAVSGGRAPIR